MSETYSVDHVRLKINTLALPFNKEALERGDILFYIHEEANSFYLPLEIDEEGIIIHKKNNARIHYLLYEGNGRISDVADDDGFKIVRMRNLEDILRPDIELKHFLTRLHFKDELTV